MTTPAESRRSPCSLQTTVSPQFRTFMGFSGELDRRAGLGMSISGVNGANGRKAADFSQYAQLAKTTQPPIMGLILSSFQIALIIDVFSDWLFLGCKIH